MRRDDRDDPFDDIFSEIERMMEEMTGGVAGDAGFGGDAHVSVYETDERVRVVADMPGVDKDDIDIKCDGRSRDASEQSSCKLPRPTRSLSPCGGRSLLEGGAFPATQLYPATPCGSRERSSLVITKGAKRLSNDMGAARLPLVVPRWRRRVGAVLRPALTGPVPWIVPPV